jgi:hypothetical protein
MTWKPISLEDLQALVSRELADCTAEARVFFSHVSFAPTKWRQSPWGDEGGGFWAIATNENRVLWYNDIEDGFNVSRFSERGNIPTGEYWCNQDPLKWAIPRLQGKVGMVLGPPHSMGDDD